MNNKEDLIKKLKNDAKTILDSNETTHGISRVLHLLIKELDLYLNHLDGSQKWVKHNPNKIPTKVQIGGGTHIIDGFLNIDIVPPADVVYDIREGIPLVDESVEFLFSEHFFEHIDYPTSAKKFINECFRIMKKKGKVILGVPDAELVLKNYIKKDMNFYQEMINRWYSKRDCLKDINTYIDLVNYHFRDQDANVKYNPHYWDYDFEKLSSLFIGTGFSDVHKWQFNGILANPKRKWGSIYIEAIK